MTRRIILLDLRKTSSLSGVSSGDSILLLSDGEVAEATSTAELVVLGANGASEAVGILRKSSVMYNHKQYGKNILLRHNNFGQISA